MKFTHIRNNEARSILEGTVDCGKEELDFLVNFTLGAWQLDNSPECLAYTNLNNSAWEARKDAIDNIHENWGNGDDGNSATLQACKVFWSS